MPTRRLFSGVVWTWRPSGGDGSAAVGRIVNRMIRFGPVAFLLALQLGSGPAVAQEIRAQDFITVERIVLDAFVTDAAGYPITNLRPSDFRIRIGGKEALVESVEWIDATAELTPAQLENAEIEPKGRRIVVFFQTDFARERIGGQMAIRSYAIDFLKGLTPQDRVAVVSYDSHLRLRQDFTNDLEKLERAIDESMMVGGAEDPGSKILPSLWSRIDRKEARQAATPEKALFVIGNALNPIEGAKTLVLFGWGLGRFGRGGVHMIRDYTLAQRALERSRTSVFSLDISKADYHSLEVGLQKASADTGGFYVKTHNFPRLAINKLQRTISGRYEIVLHRPNIPRGRHQVSASVRNNRRAEVMVRATYEDK